MEAALGMQTPSSKTECQLIITAFLAAALPARLITSDPTILIIQTDSKAMIARGPELKMVADLTRLTV
jgi:hypothetical protein